MSDASMVGWLDHGCGVERRQAGDAGATAECM